MSAERPSCHGVSGGLLSCSGGTLTPGKVHKLFWHLRRHGWRQTLRRVLARATAPLDIGRKDRATVSRVKTSAEEVLHLQPGDWVEVRSESEIRATLDANGRCKGLLWMDNMSRFCGRRFCVAERLERMMLESDGRMRRLKNTVLLDGVTCEDLYDCDRSCFHFWREAWLRKVTDSRWKESGGIS